MLGLFGSHWGENVMHIFTGEEELVSHAPNTTKALCSRFQPGRSESSQVSEKSRLFLKFSECTQGDPSLRPAGFEMTVSFSA